MKTTINNEVITSSIGVTKKIFEESERINKYLPDSSILYADRIEYLKGITGDSGTYSFIPEVTKDIVADYRRIFDNRDGYKYANAIDTSYYNTLSEYLYKHITSANLLSNTVPDILQSWIKRVQSNEGVFKEFNSPKLSKMLTKLYGEHSDVVKWYTNRCPKKLEKGKSDKYKITLSVLPHHIAGMSYYSPRNKGERGWINGWEGSSCMDTVLNSNGENIIRLVPNIKDSFLAIAYLSEIDDNNLDSPKFLARTLVRAIDVGNDKWLLLGCRTYSVSNETTDVLNEGLSNEFKNFASVYTIRDNYKKIDGIVKFVNDCVVTIESNVNVECGRCDGEGEYCDEECGRCDGNGYVYKDIEVEPYIDDTDYLWITGDGKIGAKLPKAFLSDKNLLNEADEDSELMEVGA